MDNTPTIDSDKLNTVLLFTQDILDRCQITPMALKDTAKQMKDTERGLTPSLNLRCIELGVQKRYLNSVTEPMLRGLLKMYNIEHKWTDSGISFIKDEVPVFIKIIKLKYKFFQNPNKTFYRTVEFETANPFDNYWTARFIIR